MNTRQITKEFKMAQWAEVIQDRKASGENVKEYCKNRGLKRDAYFYWQRQLRNAACEQLALIQTGQIPSRVEHGCFTEMEFEDAPQAYPYGRLSIEVPGARIDADHAYPIDQLAYLLREMVKPC